MQPRSPVFACSTVELAFLASLLGKDSLTGISDPFHNWPADSVEAAWAEARQTLAGRRLIALEPDGGVRVEDSLAALVGTCGFAEASFLVTYTAAGAEPVGHHFHVMENAAVEVIVPGESGLTCTLSELEGPGAVLGRVLELFCLRDQTGPAVPNGSLPEPAWRHARTLARRAGGQAAGAFLRQAGLDASTAGALGRSLEDPVTSGTVAALPAIEAIGRADGLGLLEGQNGLWLLRNMTRGGAQWVDIVPCGAAAMGDFIRTIMTRALPGRLQ